MAGDPFKVLLDAFFDARGHGFLVEDGEAPYDNVHRWLQCFHCVVAPWFVRGSQLTGEILVVHDSEYLSVVQVRPVLEQVGVSRFLCGAKPFVTRRPRAHIAYFRGDRFLPEHATFTPRPFPRRNLLRVVYGRCAAGDSDE